MLRNVKIIIQGQKVQNFCVYCCMNEFGSESREDREDCLKGCLDVNFNKFLIIRQVTLNKAKHGFTNYNTPKVIDRSH